MCNENSYTVLLMAFVDIIPVLHSRIIFNVYLNYVYVLRIYIETGLNISKIKSIRLAVQFTH